MKKLVELEKRMKAKTVNKDILLMRDCGIIEYDSKINKWILRRSIL